MSDVATVDCPFTAAGSTGAGQATFNVPKAAKNLRYTIRDQVTGAVYDKDHPICGGTTMSVSDSFTPGANEDQLVVDYKLTSNGSSNPSESHPIIVVAEWDLVIDLGVTKTILDSPGERGFTAENAVTFVITIHNYGPATTRGIVLADQFAQNGFFNAGFIVTHVEQTKGPASTDGPAFLSPSNLVAGQWTGLEPGKEIVIQVTGYAKTQGVVLNSAGVQSTDTGFVEPATDPHPNNLDTYFYVLAPPSTRIGSIKNLLIKGTAVAGQPAPPPMKDAETDVGQVQVAILQEGGGQPFAGLAQRRRAGATACKWLKSAKAKFEVRQAVDGVCDSPLWLNAKGTTKWSFQLKRALPTGRYVIYSRGISAGGAAEGLFDAAAGNVKEIRVH